jgi:hypothetical protein
MRWGTRKWEPKLTVRRDSGLLFDCTGPHGAFWEAWKRCIEFQVEEDNDADLFPLGGTSALVPVINPKDWHYDPSGVLSRFGSGANSVGGRASHLAGHFENPPGQWNDLDLYTIGQTALFVVNGHLINVLRDMQMESPQKTEAPLTSGQIQLQSEGAECDYRRITIEPITGYPSDLKQAAKL